jgi:quinoprotein glucose dehydrogenase
MGLVAGVDLTTDKIAYQHVNGTVRDLSRIPMPFKLGVPGIGGPIVTRGGVVFLSGTLDYFLRATTSSPETSYGKAVCAPAARRRQ